MVDVWTEVARRCNISREFAKREAYRVLYSGPGGPRDWLDYLLLHALREVHQ